MTLGLRTQHHSREESGQSFFPRACKKGRFEISEPLEVEAETLKILPAPPSLVPSVPAPGFLKIGRFEVGEIQETDPLTRVPHAPSLVLGAPASGFFRKGRFEVQVVDWQETDISLKKRENNLIEGQGKAPVGSPSPHRKVYCVGRYEITECDEEEGVQEVSAETQRSPKSEAESFVSHDSSHQPVYRLGRFEIKEHDEKETAYSLVSSIEAYVKIPPVSFLAHHEKAYRVGRYEISETREESTVLEVTKIGRFEVTCHDPLISGPRLR